VRLSNSTPIPSSHDFPSVLLSARHQPTDTTITPKHAPPVQTISPQQKPFHLSRIVVRLSNSTPIPSSHDFPSVLLSARHQPTDTTITPKHAQSPSHLQLFSLASEN
jgi:hypothetical protein